MLRETYSRPVYGAPGGILSRNFSSPDGIAWIEAAAEAIDAEGNASVIADGGAAATAYARLQFEDMNEETRERIRAALLRYCELDTLAMVMVVQAWQGMIDADA